MPQYGVHRCLSLSKPVLSTVEGASVLNRTY